MPQRKRYLFVCTNVRPPQSPRGDCSRSGSEELHRQLKVMLATRGLDHLDVRACKSSCLDVCHRGPVIAVEPDHYFYGGVTAADLPELVDALAAGGRVERLVIPADQFDEPDADG